MKNSKIKLFAVVGLATLTMMSCKSNTEEKNDNLNDAIEKVNVAEAELSEARLDSINEYTKYRTEMDAKLVENEKQIALVKAKIKLQKAEMRTKMEKDLNKLIQKNEAFKTEIKNHIDADYTNWENFKQDFNKNMDELGKSISEMAQDNMK